MTCHTVLSSQALHWHYGVLQAIFQIDTDASSDRPHAAHP